MSGDCKSGTFNKDMKYVKLNVGGTLFMTTVQTLTKYDTMLRAMFNGGLEVLTDREGALVISRRL
jgi:BTB/POZ domain-containing adapter for CUL3-mediated RhoA degradation protein